MGLDFDKSFPARIVDKYYLVVMNVREKRVLAMPIKVVPRTVTVLPKIKYVKGSSGYSFNPRKLGLNMRPNMARVQLIVCKTITQKHHRLHAENKSFASTSRYNT